jgi:hypothetical protein
MLRCGKGSFHPQGMFFFKEFEGFRASFASFRTGLTKR